jgi:hypothetical protein
VVGLPPSTPFHEITEAVTKSSLINDLSGFRPAKRFDYNGELFVIMESGTTGEARFAPIKDPVACSYDTLDLFKSETEVCIDMLLAGEGTTLEKV